MARGSDSSFGFGLAADRPASPGASVRACWFSTDTFEFSFWDGSAWSTTTNLFDTLDPLTTKGDIIAHNGTHSVRVPVGSNGQIVVADSSDAEGLVYRTNLVSLTSDFNTNSTTPVDITGLSIPIAANRKYAFEIMLFWVTSSAGEAPRCGVNGPASPTNLRLNHMMQSTSSSIECSNTTAYDSSMSHVNGSTTEFLIVMRGSIENGANAGNFVARGWTETGGTESTTFLRGSYMRVTEIP